MDVINSPNPADEPNLMYKLQRKLKVFDESAFPNRGYNLLATSSKYGLVFIGLPSPGFSVYQLRDVISAQCARPPRAVLPLHEPPTHLAVSCDRDTLAVCTRRHLHIYTLQALQSGNVMPLSVPINDNPNAYVTAIQWNPCLGDTLALAFSDGSLLIGQLKGTDFPFKKIPAKAMCLCWSPKGKQLVSGNTDGTLAQYKPDLTPVKLIPAPAICGASPTEALAVHWISNYQFAVVYKNSTDNSRPYVTIVNTPKAGASACINYEDVCYSMGTARPWYYYLLSVAQWGLLVASSSNSMEVATLATTDSVNWIQWCQLEEAKPELPLNKKQDSYPVGIAFDTSAIHQLTWNENDTLPHMPLLLVVSDTGLLVVFNVLNLRPGAPQICAQPQPFTLPASLIIAESPEVVEGPPPAPAPAPASTIPASVAAFTMPPLAPLSANSSQNGVIHHPPPVKPVVVPVPAMQQANSTYGQFQNGGFNAHSEVKPPPELIPQQQHKSTPSQPQPTSTPASQPSESTEQQSAKSEAKAAEVRAAAARAADEIRAMLVKEVNSFQAELYKFIQKARNVDIKQVDMNSVMELSEKLQDLNAERIEKDCSLESLNAAVVELKLDMVKAFALLAEARSKPGSDEESRRQVEPLWARTVESVRRRACQLQAQLEAAERVLNEQWSQLYARSQRTGKRGDRMAIPALDAIYQPLVRQQEILNRQRAMIRTLTGTMQDTNSAGSHPSKDPLSRLTKSILKMRIDPKEPNASAGGLTANKLEALRDLLTNHKTVRIKPVNFEMQRHLATIKDTHDRLLEEMREMRLKRDHTTPQDTQVKQEESIRNDRPAPLKQEPVHKEPSVPKEAPKAAPILKPAPTLNPTSVVENPKAVEKLLQKPVQEQPKTWWKPVPQAVVVEGQSPSFQPNVLNWAQQLKTPDNNGKSVTITASNIASVAKNILGDATKPDVKPAPAPAKPLGDNLPTSAAESAIKSLLQNKNGQTKDEGTFFGQKICSPTAAPTTNASPFATSSPFSAASFKSPPAATFSGPSIFANANSKSFMFSNPVSEPSPQKPTENTNEAKSEETGEADSTKKEPTPPLKKDIETKPSNNEVNSADIENQMAGLFGEKTTVEPPKGEAKPTLPEEKSENATPSQAPATTVSAEKSAVDVSRPFSFTPLQETKPTTPGSIFGMPTSTNAKIGSIFGGTSELGAQSPPVASSASTAVSMAPTAVSMAPTAASVAPTVASVAPTVASSAPTAASMAPTAASVFASASSAPAPIAATPSSIFASASPESPPVSPPVATAAFASPPATGALFPGASAAAAAAVAAASAGAADPGTLKPVIVASPPAPTAPSTPVSAPASVSAGPFAPAAVATTAASIFGSPSAGNIFGSPPAFGASPTPASVFGAPAPSTPASVFGTPAPTSVFGSPAAQSPQSVFGASPVAASPAGSIFGGAPATTASSMFGASDATSMFGAASIGGNAQSTSVFGGSNAASSVFGGGGSNVFGSKPAFGQTSPASIFGGGGASTFGQQQKPTANIFGSSSPGFGSSFGSQTTQASSIFGGGGGGFGASPSQPSAFGAPSTGSQTSMFGSTEPAKPVASVFGSPQQSPSAFGGGAVFGSKPVFGQSTGFSGTGAFSSGFSSGNVSQSGFGAAPAFGSKSPGGGGFGGGAVFGGSPTFGGGGAFGSTSPGKMFGSNSPDLVEPAAAPDASMKRISINIRRKFKSKYRADGFGAPMQQSSTFENLATQNTLSFGNLAQQSPQPSHQQPTFNTSPSFSGWRG